MKILVLQLTRLGDIFITWPVLRALRRKYPDADLRLMVRRRFQPACAGLAAVNGVIPMDSEVLLGPLLGAEADVAASLEQVGAWIEPLRAEKFDQVINLSFSPASSFLTHLIAGDQIQTNGYSRHADGSLAICDEVSAYFYAQVGLYRQNRIHAAELLAGVAGVKLAAGDWSPPAPNGFEIPRAPYLAVHVGASQEGKSYSAPGWARAIQEILKWWTGSVYLLGAPQESEKAAGIVGQVGSARVASLAGQTKVPDLFALIQGARLLIGCDSSPIHVASLTGTPCLNLSFSTVNFWETGPKAKGSRVIWAASPSTLQPSTVSDEAARLVNGEKSVHAVVEVDGPGAPYRLVSAGWPEFQWRLIEYIYFGGPWPSSTKFEVLEGALKLNEINQLAIEQIHNLRKNPSNKEAVQILDRADEMFAVVPQLVPDLSPLVRWLQTHKSMIPPASLNFVLDDTLLVHRRFADLLAGIRVEPPKEQTP